MKRGKAQKWPLSILSKKSKKGCFTHRKMRKRSCKSLVINALSLFSHTTLCETSFFQFTTICFAKTFSPCKTCTTTMPFA
jgi:hypothetical protein